MRGTPRYPRRHQPSSRFIPACAGNTKDDDPLGVTRAVHPRVCGEHRRHPALALSQPGSSPRVRGTPDAVLYEHTGDRFIPACAGNTVANGFSVTGTAVHPRVCGEHYPRQRWHSHLVGSSPRVRGTQGNQTNRRKPLRFIPACAGNTWPLEADFGLNSVHPRVCGEHNWPRPA